MSHDNGERVFVREISGEYSMETIRRRQLARDRLRASDLNEFGEPFVRPVEASTYAPWRVGPGDPEFLTQSIQVHFRDVAPGASSGRHGHQNEAVFYILEGVGYDIDDEVRYDYEAGDVLMVHPDSVHEHFNSGVTEWLKTLVFKAKSMWLLLGLIEQGKTKTQPDEAFYPVQEWGGIWSEDVGGRDKLVRSGDGEWRDDPRVGRVRVILDKDIPNQRIFSIDLVEQVIEPGATSVTHRHMADEVVYVLSGEGTSLHRDVRSEIDSRYRARVAREHREWEVKAGEVLYIPHNTIHQFRASGHEPLRFLSAQNRLFRYLGYDSVVSYQSWDEAIPVL